MPILGLRTPTNVAANERPEAWRQGINLLFPNGDFALTGLSSYGRNEDVSDYKFHWYEKGLPTQRIFINNAAGYTSTATSIVVDDGAAGSASFNTKAGTVLMNERTFEKMIVSADPTTDTITVARQKGTTVAASMVDNDALLIMGSSYEDGNTAHIGAVQYDPVEKFNYCQIFGESYLLTRRALKVQFRTGDKLQETRRETLLTHLRGIESSAFFGEPLDEAGVGTSSSRRTFTGGLYSVISTNIHDAGGALTYFEAMDFLEQDLRYGSQNKLVLAGSTAINAWNKLAKLEMTMNAVPGEDSFGMAMKEIITPFGKSLYMMQHPMLSINPVFRSWMWIVDMDQFKVRIFDDTQLIEHVQDNNVKRLEAEYYTDLGWEISQESTHAYWKNLTSATA